VPEGPWLYPEDQIADLPMRMIAAEITREKLTLRLHQELPYQLTVETENWEERKDGSARIDQVIYVARDGHKGIVLGNKGETIKAVSRPRARRSRNFWAAACTCSCRSRCARTGWKRRSGIPRWGSISRTGREPRLTAEFWVSGLSPRLRLADIPAFVVARGDATAGAVLVKLRPRSTAGPRASAQFRPDDRRTAWMVLAEGPEAEVDAAHRAAARLRSRPLGHRGGGSGGRHLLEEPGLD
jgi:hypothetical protein